MRAGEVQRTGVMKVGGAVGCGGKRRVRAALLVRRIEAGAEVVGWLGRIRVASAKKEAITAFRWAGSPTRVGRARERVGGSNSVVESQPSKLLVAGSIPVSRSSLCPRSMATRASAGESDSAA